MVVLSDAAVVFGDEDEDVTATLLLSASGWELSLDVSGVSHVLGVLGVLEGMHAYVPMPKGRMCLSKAVLGKEM